MRISFVAALLISLSGLSVATTALAKDNVVVTENARAHFTAGVAYLDDPAGPKYEEAYREFRLAYADSPAYRILTNIGLCALNLERDGEAIEAYTEFLAHATPEDIPKAKRAIMERDIVMLKASLVKLDLTSSPPTISITDERVTSKGEQVINRYDLTGGRLALGIHPGHHRITAKANGYQPETWEFEADSASRHTHSFALKPVDSSPSPAEAAPLASVAAAPADPGAPPSKKTPTLVYVGLGATGVFAATGSILGLFSLKKHSDFRDANETAETPDRAEDLRASSKRLALFADVGFGLSALSAVGTAIVYFTSKPPKTEHSSSFSATQIAPVLSPNGASLTVSGKF